MSVILTITFICTIAVLIAVWAICLVAWTIFLVAWAICWRYYLELVLQHLVGPASCSKCLNEYIFILRLLEFLADEAMNSRQTSASEEVRVFLWEDLKSAEIIIDGKKSWKLVLDKGGESLIKELWRSGADLTKLDENGKTMLHVAVEHGNKPVVLLLQSLGFNMKAKDSRARRHWTLRTKKI